MTDEEIIDLVRMNASSILELKDQLGLLVRAVCDLQMASNETNLCVDLLRSTEKVSRSQRLRIHDAAMIRVDYLLGIEYEDGKVAKHCEDTYRRYRKGFVNRIYYDAKKYTTMGGTYDVTRSNDIDDVLRYIDIWMPEYEGGVEGYKRHLDDLREKREAL